MMTDKIKIWIAGFGNEYREDDGAGVLLAERLYRYLETIPQADATLCLEHQLLPELAEDLAEVDLAFFCDADTQRHESGYLIRELNPNPKLAGFNIHSMGPEWLLALAEDIGTSPKRALLLTISGERFDFSPTPTDICMERIDRAEAAIRALDLFAMTKGGDSIGR